MQEQPILNQIKTTLNIETTACVECGKQYPTAENLHIDVQDDVKEVSLVCPHCHFSYHIYYIDKEFETRTKKLQTLFAKYRKTKVHQHLLEAQIAQAAYRKDFEKFNRRLRAKRKPYRVRA